MLFPLISGRSDGGGLLCLWCMNSIAQEKQIVGSAMLHFYGGGPFGLSAGSGPTTWDDHELTVALVEAEDRCVKAVARAEAAEARVAELEAKAAALMVDGMVNDE